VPTTTVASAVVENAADTPAATTPLLALGRSRLAVPGLGALALMSAFGALEITKRPRREPAPRSEGTT
jgi:hypothetical protein